MKRDKKEEEEKKPIELDRLTEKANKCKEKLEAPGKAEEAKIAWEKEKEKWRLAKLSERKECHKMFVESCRSCAKDAKNKKLLKNISCEVCGFGSGLATMRSSAVSSSKDNGKQRKTSLCMFQLASQLMSECLYGAIDVSSEMLERSKYDHVHHAGCGDWC
ncbi:hypothetical protein BWQ96_07933 [Gracilariopsis chorda]|uniref:Uncharacterized protein n=1 Tax=Gracilariopsis chorda TaxID=448386 RepID=A0A2V3IJR8_9FLOR|nr:hypothetical protein BWQ96_07933 [Gracilariopsis chorda]|eukprot:PXF42344.1 hypothetical protein BWQ96_07933 [Gracilariopsis chorda]